ncbi:hypothetical protein F5Y10DRAFT_284121 [Nemania abortiva]|nr:hypothetical protein F5Y10DRAFT_284121 [Nemania abortiva]
MAKKNRNKKGKGGKGQGVQGNPGGQKSAEHVPESGPTEKPASEGIIRGSNGPEDSESKDIELKGKNPENNKLKDTKAQETQEFKPQDTKIKCTEPQGSKSEDSEHRVNEPGDSEPKGIKRLFEEPVLGEFKHPAIELIWFDNDGGLGNRTVKYKDSESEDSVFGEDELTDVESEDGNLAEDEYTNSINSKDGEPESEPESDESSDLGFREIVVIIGFLSFIGYETAIRAIDSGYTVYAVIGPDSLEKVIQFIETFPTRCVNRLFFKEIGKTPTTKELVEAFRGADQIIYTASPSLADSKHPSDVSAVTNVHILRNIIDAAKLSDHIQRIIVTSSITAYFTPEELDDWVGTKEILSETSTSKPIPFSCSRRPSGEHDPVHFEYSGPPYDPPHDAAEYASTRASELILAEFHDLMDKEIAFDFVHLLVTNVFGVNRLARTVEDFYTGSNARLLNHVRGKGRERLIATSVHIDDVTRCHVEALSTTAVPSGRYILTGGHTNWFDAILFVKEQYPELIGTEVVPTRITPCKINNAWTKKIFGKRFIGFEKQVKDTVSGYIFLLLKEKHSQTETGQRKFAEETMTALNVPLA